MPTDAFFVGSGPDAGFVGFGGTADESPSDVAYSDIEEILGEFRRFVEIAMTRRRFGR